MTRTRLAFLAAVTLSMAPALHADGDGMLIGWRHVSEFSRPELRNNALKAGGRLICRQDFGNPENKLGTVDEDDMCVNRDGERIGSYFLMYNATDSKAKWASADGGFDGEALQVGENLNGPRFCLGMDGAGEWPNPWKDLGYMQDGACHTMRSSGGRRDQQTWKVLRYRFEPAVSEELAVVIRQAVSDFAPTLLFHESEAFYPMGVGKFVSGVERGSDDGPSLRFSADSWVQGVAFGDLESTKAYVNVKVMSDRIDIQYWIFFPYNVAWVEDTNMAAALWNEIGDEIGAHANSVEGYNPVSYEAGVHEGDWEHITVRIDMQGSFRKAYYEAHGHGEWYGTEVFNTGGTNDGIFVYVARDSHGFYPTKDGNTTFDKSWAGVRGFDDTRATDKWVNTRNKVVILAVQKLMDYEGRPRRFEDVGGQFETSSPDWLRFTGRWGRKLADIDQLEGEILAAKLQALNRPALRVYRKQALTNYCSTDAECRLFMELVRADPLTAVDLWRAKNASFFMDLRPLREIYPTDTAGPAPPWVKPHWTSHGDAEDW